MNTNMKFGKIILFASIILLSNAFGAVATADVQKNMDSTKLGQESVSTNNLTPYAHIYLNAPSIARIQPN